ncbi:MAG: amidohydrolase [Proteobacteria bacterium]|nr:amidohydrolase [Pseudomonadota bacterium]
MPHEALERARQFQAEITAIRRDIHANPELGMEEYRTSDLVARKLEEWGIEVHRGVGKTGVVGVLRSGNGEAAVGLRADMDALPILEATGLPHASTRPGLMHACGHDGHTATLLGAAKYLAETRNFNGTVHFIFQPAEEGLGGAEAMLKDGLFDRFPCNYVYGMHNRPGLAVGKFIIGKGVRMAGGAFFDITITGKGAHGARPQESIDPVVVACHLGTALQTVVARNISPNDTAVLSITKIVGGDAYNVIPERAVLSGTARTLKRSVMEAIEARMKQLCPAIAEGFGAKAEVDFRFLFAPLVNNDAEADDYGDAAAELVGEENLDRNASPASASEDFSFMLERVPGAHINFGHGETAAVHNDKYDFNDEAIPYAVALFARIVEKKLPKGAGD